MSILTGNPPARSYFGLLNTSDLLGLTSTLKVIQDGLGHVSPLSLSTNALNINTQIGGLESGFFIDNVKLESDAEEIDAVCQEANFEGFSCIGLPLGTTSERPDPVSEGDFRFNTTLDAAELYTAGGWTTLGAGGSVTSINAETDNNNLVISGVPITTIGTINISLSDILTNLTSISVGSLSLYNNVVATIAGNTPIVLSPHGTGVIELTANTEIYADKTLKFFAENNTNYITFKAGASVVNQNFIWPSEEPNDGQVLGFLSGASLGWVDVGVTPVESTINALPRFSNTTGSIKNSGVILDDSGNLTGLLSATFGNIAVNTTTNRISTLSNNDLMIEPNGTGSLYLLADTTISPSGATPKLIIEANTGIGTVTPENPLHVVGSVQFKGITSGWTGTGSIRSQSSLVISDGSSGFIDFPIGAIDSTTLFVNAKIVITQGDDGLGAQSYFSNSVITALYCFSGTPQYVLAGNPPTLSSPIAFTGTTVSISGTWSISGSNLRLTINNLSGGAATGIMYAVISSEIIAVKSTDL